ncbi:MAG: restriction endonuclease subunit S [Oscillospiraceae bacterium]|nr:restriction endonuclease subunit S [Oscillospiraceae bacterium]
MVTKLCDVCDVRDGTHDSPQYVLEGYPLVTSKNIIDGKLNLSTINYISKEDYYKINDRSNVESGDIIMPMIGTIGNPFLVGEYSDFAIKNVALIKFPNDSINNKYVYYFLKSDNFYRYVTENNRGGTQKFLSLKDIRNMEIPVVDICCQNRIVEIFEKIDLIIDLRKKQLSKLDEFVKSRFIELFGDPITNSNNLPTEKMEQRFGLKAGITTAADDIHDFQEAAYEIPCYGGNGIRGYVKEKSYTGDYPIIGRQGALCGNVQYATGDFHATEHAVLVSLLKNDNSVWVYHLLKLMDLYRYHTGAAQPGLAVKTLNKVEVIVADKTKQEQFAAFVEQTDKSKLAIQKSLEQLEALKKSLMQQYFG